MTTPSIVWLRQDLRLHDQPAFAAAARDGAVIPVYVLDDDIPGKWKIGGAQRWWLHHSLAHLRESLSKLGSRLILRRGSVVPELARLVDQVGTDRVHATHHYEPWWCDVERRLSSSLQLTIHSPDVLVPPEHVRTGTGTPYKIYTPYWRALQAQSPPPEPLGTPTLLQPSDRWPESDDLDDWQLVPTRPNWAASFSDEWTPGEASALERLSAFADKAQDYAARRDQPGAEGTSRFSPHLHFGELSPRLIWHSLPEATAEKFRKELIWRDFTRNVMLTNPAISDEAGRPEFATFPWRVGPSAEADFRAWTRGQTGYPVVDAGMRQLWATGWMHNRVRMITASFLVKHLLVDWRRGAEWFWDTLVDADYGNNGQNWQWVAGTGVDSQPFKRIMAPTLQSRKFEAAGYIRRWVPELAGLSDETIHEPGTHRPLNYPQPIVSHREARDRAFAALQAHTAGPRKMTDAARHHS